MNWFQVGAEASPFYVWVILPLIIFLARFADMTLDTVRIVAVARGQRLLATILGFVEILIWLVAISQVLAHLSNPLNAVAYAGGFAMGNFVGMTLEKRMALGRIVMRIITRQDASQLIEALWEKGYGLTIVPAEGRKGPVKILFTVMERQDLAEAMKLVRTFNPRAFVSVEDVREAQEGHFPPHHGMTYRFFGRMKLARKGI